MKKVRVGIIGCGTIGSYVLKEIVSGNVDNSIAIGVCGRSDRSKGRNMVEHLGIPWFTHAQPLIDLNPDVIVEAASHEALEAYGLMILEKGIDLIPTSLGALADARLLDSLKDAATRADSILLIPSGGIGGLDAVRAGVSGGMEEIQMTSRKPPIAWKEIPYVESLNIELSKITEPTVLFEGPARDCVKKFPQNINIAAALSLAGLGFDSTQIRILADPTVTRNTHEIRCRGAFGQFTIVLENIPVPENPKTTYMACYSTLTALKSLRSCYRVGT